MSGQAELNFDRRHASQASAEVVDKIRKLLRMKNGGAQGEIDNALRLARQLADKHNIDIASVDAAESSPFALMTNKRVRGALSSDDDSYAGQIIQNFFNVDVVKRTLWDEAAGCRASDYVIIGTEIDVEIAIYVFTFLRTHFKACWRLRKNKRLRDRRSFAHGVYIGIYATLRDDRDKQLMVNPTDSRKALVLSREEYTKRLFPDAKETTRREPKKNSEAAHRAGYYAGRETRIRQPLAGTPASGPLLLT